MVTISDALAAEVGGIGIAPGANIGVQLPYMRQHMAQHLNMLGKIK